MAAASAPDVDAQPHPQHSNSGEQEEVDASAAAHIKLPDAADGSKQSKCSDNEANRMHPSLSPVNNSGSVEAEDRQSAEGSIQPT